MIQSIYAPTPKDQMDRWALKAIFIQISAIGFWENLIYLYLSGYPPSKPTQYQQ